MNIIKPGELPENHEIYNGQCTLCKTIIECHKDEIKTFATRNVVKCPTQNCNNWIFIEKGKWQIPWVDPTFKRKEFYITPIVPDTEK